MPDLNTLLLIVTVGLFGLALVALLVWAFKAFFGRSSSPGGFLKPRERRLGVIETATIDTNRKLVLLRRDDVEHLMVIGGPVDMVIESGIRPRPYLQPLPQDGMGVANESRPVPEFSKFGSGSV